MTMYDHVKTAIKSVVILLPGSLNITQYVKNYIKMSSFIIAVDGGIIHAYNNSHSANNVKNIEIEPNLWIGDFDSVEDEKIFEYYRNKNLQIQQFPCDKDFLDSELAIKEAINLGFSKCILLGGIGGRADHNLALHMIPLQFPRMKFFHTDGNNVFISISSEASFLNDNDTAEFEEVEIEKNQTFSIIPLTDCKGLTLIGAKWELQNVDISSGSARCLSNIATNNSIRIKLISGILWFIYRV